MTVADVPTTTHARPAPDDEWWDFAACRAVDADLFCVPDGVAPRRKREQERRAKAICSTCPVQTACLKEALARDEQYGVWGGMDASERRQLRRRIAHGARSGVAR